MTAEAQEKIFLRYDGSLGPEIRVTPPGWVAGRGVAFQTGEIRPLERGWGAQLIQHGPFDRCQSRLEIASQFGCDVQAIEAYDGLTTAELPLAAPSEDAEPATLELLVLDDSTAHKLLHLPIPEPAVTGEVTEEEA